MCVCVKCMRMHADVHAGESVYASTGVYQTCRQCMVHTHPALPRALPPPRFGAAGPERQLTGRGIIVHNQA